MLLNCSCFIWILESSVASGSCDFFYGDAKGQFRVVACWCRLRLRGDQTNISLANFCNIRHVALFFGVTLHQRMWCLSTSPGETLIQLKCILKHEIHVHTRCNYVNKSSNGKSTSSSMAAVSRAYY